MSATVKLANETALGTYRASWIDPEGVRCEVMWGDGMPLPMVSRGVITREVSNPDRFGWARPRNYREFHKFAAAFAEEWNAGFDEDEPAA